MLNIGMYQMLSHKFCRRFYTGRLGNGKADNHSSYPTYYNAVVIFGYEYEQACECPDGKPSVSHR
jgi:hypothetical protein